MARPTSPHRGSCQFLGSTLGDQVFYSCYGLPVIVFPFHGSAPTHSRLCGRSGRCSFQAQLIGNRLLDNGTLEEARVVARVQHGGIGERELAKILFGDEALLNHLKRFGYHLAEIRHIKMREVGAEHRPQAEADSRIEGP